MDAEEGGAREGEMAEEEGAEMEESMGEGGGEGRGGWVPGKGGG